MGDILKKLKSVDVLFLCFLCGLASLIFIKAFYLNSFISAYTNSDVNVYKKVLLNDGLIYFLFTLFLYVSFLRVTPPIISYTLKTVAFLLVSFYAFDLIVFSTFHTRLITTDIFQYGKNFQYVFNLHYEFILFLPALFVFLIALRAQISSLVVHGISMALIFLFAGCCLLKDNGDYVHSWVYENYIAYNLSVASQRRPYIEMQRADLDELFPQTCVKTEARDKPNVIMLMVESLSLYHSALFSGIHNWTPRFDGIAEQNIMLGNMVSNGYNTEDAEVALLTGEFPIPAPQARNPDGNADFAGFYNHRYALPVLFQEEGYRSEFITSASLSFSSTGEWAESLGFDYIEGSEHIYYKDWPRFAFSAAADEALYTRALSRIKENAKQKFFLFVKTASTHHPFTDPVSGVPSEEKTVKYADKQIGAFYDHLIKSGFFENGLLIITGDHRTMTALNRNEIEAFGVRRAAARVPAIISYGGRRQSVYTELSQHTDIYNGLKNLISDRVCFSALAGDPFVSTPIFPKYVLHKQGGRRGEISVFSGQKNAAIKLDGDQTRYVTEPHFHEAQKLITYISSKRISRAEDQ